MSSHSRASCGGISAHSISFPLFPPWLLAVEERPNTGQCIKAWLWPSALWGQPCDLIPRKQFPAYYQAIAMETLPPFWSMSSREKNCGPCGCLKHLVGWDLLLSQTECSLSEHSARCPLLSHRLVQVSGDGCVYSRHLVHTPQVTDHIRTYGLGWTSTQLSENAPRDPDGRHLRHTVWFLLFRVLKPFLMRR